MKILICGDSFAADWTVKYTGNGWPNLLANQFIVKNIAQAGCSQYKIYKQLLSENLNNFDCIIVSHTSPYRIYVKDHPIHKNDILHNNSDLIYADVKEHQLDSVVDFFENYFSFEYAEFVHNLICEKVDNLNINQVIHITHFNWDRLYKFNNMINFQEVFEKHQGLINHYNEIGNDLVFKRLLKEIYD